MEMDKRITGTNNKIKLPKSKRIFVIMSNYLFFYLR